MPDPEPESWLHPDLEVRRSEIAGSGLFARVAIPAGTIVVRPGPAAVTERGLLNHACDPNLGWADEHSLETLRELVADEELVVDYAMSTTDPDFILRCHCTSYRCRQMVEGGDWEIPQLQKRYAGHWAPHVQRLIDDTPTKSQA